MDAIYARQSIFKKDSISIESQIEDCKEKLKSIYKKQNPMPEPVIYQESKSGKSTENRLQFQQMMEDVRSGKINRIVVYKLDRISRNLLDFCKMWDELKRYKVSLIAVNDDFDTSSKMGEAMLMISMVFAQMERDAIIQRVTDNYMDRAQQGFYLGGYAPFGLKKVDIEWKGKKTAAYEEDESTVVRLQKLFYDYAYTNISLGKLAEQLTQEGVSTARGKLWAASSLGRILRSPVYVQADARVYQYLESKGAHMNNPVEDYIGENGCYLYALQKEHSPEEQEKRSYVKKKSGRKFSDLSAANVTLAPHKGVISADVWLACQYKLDNNKQVKCDRSGTHTWLSGLMRCGKCQYGVTVVNNNRGHNYINCYGRKLHVCSGRAKAWQMYEIEDDVQVKLLAHLAKLVNTEAKELVAETNPEVEERRRSLIKLEKKVELVSEELLEARERGVESTVKQMRKKLDGLNKEIEKTYTEISHFENEDNNRRNNIGGDIDIPFILENWNNDEVFDMAKRKAVARGFIQHVIIGDDTIQVVFY